MSDNFLHLLKTMLDDVSNATFPSWILRFKLRRVVNSLVLRQVLISLVLNLVVISSRPGNFNEVDGAIQVSVEVS